MDNTSDKKTTAKSVWVKPELASKAIKNTLGTGSFNQGVGQGKGSSGSTPVS